MMCVEYVQCVRSVCAGFVLCVYCVCECGLHVHFSECWLDVGHWVVYVNYVFGRYEWEVWYICGVYVV